MVNTKDKKIKGLDNLIIIGVGEAKKVEKFLNKEHIDYKIYNSRTSLKNKSSSPKNRDIREVMKTFEKAMIKTK